MTDKIKGLKLLREPFKSHQIGRLPKPTKAQTQAVRVDFKSGVRCAICGGWHHPKVIHLDYVGHAALTDRFLDVDDKWSWEPMALNDLGLPALDVDGLLWIKLTIDGVTRLGVGDAGDKQGGDAMKERIGDALRNAGMRFGAALDLWHKGDLHVEDTQQSDVDKYRDLRIRLEQCASTDDLALLWGGLSKEEMRLCEMDKNKAKERLGAA